MAVLVEEKVRLCTEDDIPFLYKMMKKKYSPNYDAITTEGWFRNLVLKQPLVFLPQRTENAFCVSMLSVAPWLPGDFECSIVCIAADDGHQWEALQLMRASIEWAKARKCKVWKVWSDTDVDLMPLARRIGAQEVSPRWTVRF